MLDCETTLSRRSLLGASATLAAWAYAPRFAFAAQGRDARLVTIILRGALDGLSAVPPLGDPDYAALRANIALSRDGASPALPLDNFFGLHPAMPNFARLYASRQALVVHATATSYRQRSHFDGQDVLESGMAGPGATDSGWMNRMLQTLAPGERIGQHGGLSIGATTPLIMRGKAPVLGWAPQSLQRTDEDTISRVLGLYQNRDPRLASALSAGMATEGIASRSGMGGKGPQGGIDYMKQISAGAAHLMASADGPRMAALAFDGWDTHFNEGGATGALARVLGGLDDSIATFESVLGPVWKDTVILVATEFGRTARVNGTVGTDHGTGTVALLAGGAVRGGRVLADWPGLKPAQLYEGRDLAPTTDLRAVIKGVLADHLGLSPDVMRKNVFPGSDMAGPMKGLIV
jgi:uncharacterized protein (DUF1501 family)